MATATAVRVAVGALLKGLTPQFILRVGYVEDYPDPVSPRRRRRSGSPWGRCSRV